MPSRLSIFSSRVLRSACFWAVVAIAGLEWSAARWLPSRYFSHEVDQLLWDLDRQVYSNKTVCLGDSVGRQISQEMLKRRPGLFDPLACNAAIETTGQYYLLLRYLERNPHVCEVLLIMGYPSAGELRGPFTENYVQRCFLRWREIGRTTWDLGNPAFGAVMGAYKLLPSMRYRIHLQKKIPWLNTPDPYSGWFNLADAEKAAPPSWGLLDQAAAWLARWRHAGRSVGEINLERLLALLQDRGIRLLYLPAPNTPASQWQAMQTLQARYPNLMLAPVPRVCPPEWFKDGTHFKREYLPQVTEDYLTTMGQMTL